MEMKIIFFGKFLSKMKQFPIILMLFLWEYDPFPKMQNVFIKKLPRICENAWTETIESIMNDESVCLSEK